MREIKFRAWNKVEKQMILVVELHNYNPRIDDAEYYVEGIIGESDERYKLSFRRNMELMQYTGLKDKNGKEIYEGDIVKINHPQDVTGDFTNSIGVVFWWDIEGGWYHTNNKGRPPKRMWEYVKVIGNKYENPELLEENKR